MQISAYVGIDVAVADGKRLPVCVCCWRDDRLVPLPLKTPGHDAGAGAWMLPPEMPGNERIVDPAVRTDLAREVVEYLRAAEEGWGVRIARIGIDAPREPGPGDAGLRACEAALRERGISFIQTPGQAVFDRLPGDVAAHLRDPGARKGLPHANQISMLFGMLFGFELRVLSAEGWECLDPVSLDPLRPVAFGRPDDCLDAYLAAWVAALDEEDREPLGTPPRDAIWIPRVGAPVRS